MDKKIGGIGFERDSCVRVRASSSEKALAFFGYSSETHLVVDDGPVDGDDSLQHYRIFKRGAHLSLS